MKKYLATCINVLDLGNHFVFKDIYDGRINELGRHIAIVWELYNAPVRVIAKEYSSTSIEESTVLYNDLTVLRGKPFTHEEKRGFNLDKIIGKVCYITIDKLNPTIVTGVLNLNR